MHAEMWKYCPVQVHSAPAELGRDDSCAEEHGRSCARKGTIKKPYQTKWRPPLVASVSWIAAPSLFPAESNPSQPAWRRCVALDVAGRHANFKSCSMRANVGAGSRPMLTQAGPRGDRGAGSEEGYYGAARLARWAGEYLRECAHTGGTRGLKAACLQASTHVHTCGAHAPGDPAIPRGGGVAVKMTPPWARPCHAQRARALCLCRAVRGVCVCVCLCLCVCLCFTC